VVLTFNEERNLQGCLESLANVAAEIFVVDSGSTDRTVSIAERHGAKVVAHPFESHSQQWQWALATLPIRSEWVLAIDADQRLTPELGASIARALSASSDGTSGPAAFFLNRRQVFRGRWIRHGGYYPKYLLKLFRASKVRLDPNELVDHHFYVPGVTRTLRHDLVEENRKENDISFWIEKHNRYARLLAQEEVEPRTRPNRLIQPSPLGSPDQRMLWKKGLWRRCPTYVRPLLYFVYRYFFQFGFLDGKQGFVFHFLQAFWFRLLVDINVEELKSGRIH
jgi:glycosyltransferase involved in cell wall biosynthesis